MPFCLALSLVAAASMNCSPGDGAAPRSDRGFIAVVGAGRDDPLWPVLSGSALRCRTELGETELRVVAPEVVSVNAQIQLVRRLQSEGMRGLCLQVIDPPATETLLRRMANEGVVVVTLVHPVAGEEPYMHSGLDDVRMGEALADLVAEALKEKGTLAVLHADSALGYAVDRHQAFGARIGRFARITVLREFDCGGDPARAREMIAACMERYPRLNAWVAMDNWPLLGLQASQRLLPASCKLVTTDPNPQIWDTLADGRCHVMVGADYDQIARQAVSRCAIALEGKIVRWRTYLTEPRPVWGSNLHAYKLDWLKWCSTQPGD